MPGAVFGCHDECPLRNKHHTSAPHLEIHIGKPEEGCVMSHDDEILSCQLTVLHFFYPNRAFFRKFISPYHLLPPPTLKVQLFPGSVHMVWLLLTHNTLSHPLFNHFPFPIFSVVFSLHYHLDRKSVV